MFCVIHQNAWGYIGVWSTTLLVEDLLLIFSFYKVHSPTPASLPYQLRTDWVCDTLVVLPLPWLSLERLLGPFLEIPGTLSCAFFVLSGVLACFFLRVILFTWIVWRYCESLSSGLLVWYRVCFISIFVVLHLEELIGLLNGLTKIGMFYVPVVSIIISFHQWTGSMG